MATKQKVVITASDELPAGTKVDALTEFGLPDVILVPLTIGRRLSIRCAKVYLSAVLGLLGYSAVSTAAPLPIAEFTVSLQTALQMAIAPTIVNLLINLVILLTEADKESPSLMA